MNMPELAKRGKALSPRTLFPSLREEMDRMGRLFEEFFGQGELAPSAGAIWGPPMDITETEDKVRVMADLPGINPEELDISISDNILTVRGEKKEEREEQGEYPYSAERRYGSFSRSIDLPCSVDPNQVNANYHNGVLKIEMQKSPEIRRKKISVTAR